MHNFPLQLWPHISCGSLTHTGTLGSVANGVAAVYYRFDILVNGGGAVALQFQRNPFHPIKRTVVVPWNDIIVMLNPVVMSSAPSDDSDANGLPDPFNTGLETHTYTPPLLT